MPRSEVVDAPGRTRADDDSRRSRSLFRLLAGLAVGVAGMLAVATGLPIAGVVAAVALAVMTPWSAALAERLMLGLLVALASAAVALQAPDVRWGTGALVLVLAGQTALQVTVVRVRPSVPVLPRLERADVLVLLGAAGLTATLALPYVGGSTDDVLLELARGFDSVNHVLAVANLMAEQGAAWAQPSWVSPDASPVVMAGYPLGVHAAVAGALGLAGVGPSRDVVVAYAWTTALAMGLCAALLGWISVRVAAALGPERTAWARAVWAALGCAACLLLGGSIVAPFVLGHAPFVIAATAAVVASWLVFEQHARGAALAVLAVGIVGVVGAYPPLVAGLVPACVAWIWRAAPDGWRGPLRPLAIGAMSLGVVTLLWLWRPHLAHLVVAAGENSTPFVVSTIMVVLSAGAAWVAWERGWGLAPARAMAVSGGWLGAAVLLALAAARAGVPAADSYYGTKLAEAAWLGALPVLVALLAGALVRVTSRRGRLVRIAVPAAGLLSLAVLVGALPVGRAEAPLVGPATLAQRLLEARRAHGQVQVAAAAALAGPSAGDASGMIDPAGWFYPVARENAPWPQWHKDAVSASLWLATLRGARTEATDEAAQCFGLRGGVDSLPCVSGWLAAAPGRRVTLAVRAGPAAQDVQEWARSRAGQVRVVVIP